MILKEDDFHIKEPQNIHKDYTLQHRPQAIFVQFADKAGIPREWVLDGLQDDPGVYCITTQPEYWYVDGTGDIV